MDTTWILGGAAIGAIVGFWKYIKGFLYKIFSLFVVTIRLEGQNISDSVVSYCFGNLKKISWGG